MDRTPTHEQRAFERRITSEARRFDLRPLLKLLRERGYERRDILFQSSFNSQSPSIVESVEFERKRSRPFVLITLNIGLLGDSSLLPSYFFEVIEKTRDPDAFYDFLRFFDHRLLENLVYALYPEDNGRLFDDWDRARRSFFEMMGLSSVATMQWLMQQFFPELKVHIQRHPFESESNEHAARSGQASLDGSGILGKYYVADGSGMQIELIAEEEVDARGRSWAAVVRQRLVEQVLPRIESFNLPLAVRLRVLNHASWAQVESGSKARGYLGYDRIKGDAEAGHTITVYPDPSLLRSIGTAVAMLRWLFSRNFPELDVKVESHFLSAEASPGAEARRLRELYPEARSCTVVDLNEPPLGPDVDWPSALDRRLDESILPVLAPFNLPLVVRFKEAGRRDAVVVYPEPQAPVTARPGG